MNVVCFKTQVRIANIKYRLQQRKIEKALREKEQLAEGLHLVDFEQLKIENQTLHEKIEERNEELQKFVKKTTKTVQVLTHMKEKLQFVSAKRELLRQNMSELESAVAAARDRLNGLKAGRDSRKRRSKDKGSSDSDGDMIPRSLMQDYESRAKKIVKLKRKVEKLKAHFENVTELTRLRDAK
jgi:histone deacetylase 6